jgi:hypothetical protein
MRRSDQSLCGDNPGLRCLYILCCMAVALTLTTTIMREMHCALHRKRYRITYNQRRIRFCVTVPSHSDDALVSAHARPRRPSPFHLLFRWSPRWRHVELPALFGVAEAVEPRPGGSAAFLELFNVVAMLESDWESRESNGESSA